MNAILKFYNYEFTLNKEYDSEFIAGQARYSLCLTLCISWTDPKSYSIISNKVLEVQYYLE